MPNNTLTSHFALTLSNSVPIRAHSLSFDLFIFHSCISGRSICFPYMAHTQWILVLVVATLAIGVAAPPPKDAVLIQSALPGAMTVHCSGMGADLGVQSVMAGRGYSFSFYLANEGNALYSCRFDWAGHWSQFNVFAATGGNVGLCPQCLWTVRADGFYRSQAGQAPTGPVFRWN